MWFLFRASFVVLVVLHRLDAGATKSKHLRLEPHNEFYAYFTGDSFFVTCIPDPDSRATRLTWQTPDGKDITTTRGRVHVEPSKNNILGLELVIEEVKLKDQGVFRCTANVDGWEVENQFSLRVYLSISFWETPETQVGVEGTDFMIICHVRADPHPVISWYINGTYIIDGPRRIVSDDGLFVRDLKTSDAGHYICRALVATPHKSQIQDKHITVHVHYKPLWTSDLDTFYGVIGSPANLTCEAKAEPKPDFEWFKGVQLLGNSKTYGIWNEKFKSTLQVKSINYSNLGTYVCLVSNQVGEIQKKINLHEGVFPSVPSFTLSSTAKGRLEVHIQLPQHDSLPIIGYNVHYKEFDVPWKYAKEYLSSTGTEILFTGLFIDTYYTVRVQAQNAIGWSNFSEPQTQMIQGDEEDNSSSKPDTSKVLSSTFSGKSSRATTLMTGLSLSGLSLSGLLMSFISVFCVLRQRPNIP